MYVGHTQKVGNVLDKIQFWMKKLRLISQTSETVLSTINENQDTEIHRQPTFLNQNVMVANETCPNTPKTFQLNYLEKNQPVDTRHVVIDSFPRCRIRDIFTENHY